MARAKVKYWNNLTEFIEFWDEQVALASGDYRKNIDNKKRDVDAALRRGQSSDNLQAYGEPLPTSFDDAMYRRTFLNKTLYDDKYRELKPILESLEALSNRILPRPVITPNDRELGTFSLERAMMALEAELGLHDEKKDEWYALSDGIPILEKDGKPKTNAEGYNLFYLKNTKTILVLKEFEKDGEKEWGSSNKKVFLAMEKLPRPMKAIRMFVLVGANWGYDTFWAGIVGIIAAQFLESRGYAIRITGVFGLYRGSGMNLDGNKKMSEGYRFNFVELKMYDETMNALSLLYLTADPSFFRARIFTYWHAEQFYHRDTPNSGIGSMPSVDAMRGAILEKFKEKEITQEADTLYYYFGGTECVTFEGAKKQLIEMVCDAENTNREMLIKLGYAFEPLVQTNNKKVGDVDCPPPRQRP
jgi:hypothetical protein